MHGHQRDRLGHVERRAAAQADDRVGAVRAIGADAVVDLAPGRVAPKLRIDGYLETFHPGAESLQQRQGCDAAVGDDQRARDALHAQMLGDELARAGSEVDRGRKGEPVQGHRMAIV